MLLDEHRPPRLAAPRALRRSRLARWVAVVLPLTVLGVPVASYLHALRAPGSTDWQLTTVEWIRDHGGGPLVDVAENWWYAHNRPTGDAPGADLLPTVVPPGPAAVPRPVPPSARPAPLPLLPGAAPLPHEGEWAPNQIG